MTRVLALLILISCSLTALPASAAVLYGATGSDNGPSDLYILDPATGGIVSTVGPIGYAVTGLAVHPTTFVLYGSVANTDPDRGKLITIDKVTGLGTIVGSFGLPTTPRHTMADLAFTSDGTLYGWAEPDRDTLHTINIATGLATQVGPSGIGTRGSGLAATADALLLAGQNGNGPLFRIDRTSGLAARIIFGGNAGDVLSLDKLVLDGPPDPISALAFGDGGVLFGIAFPHPEASLVTIDPLTGHVTQVGSTVEFLDAIAFDPPAFPVVLVNTLPVQIPTLSDAAFIGLAVLLAAVAVHQVRRRGLRLSRG